MKKILITGANGYIGTHIRDYLHQWPDLYQVDMIRVTDDTWRMADFSGYDAVIHAAGIAHRKETEENAALYYRVNRDLTADLGQKAKDQGVPYFIFFSSMSVYGLDAGEITPDTLPNPKSHYGRSKLEGEQALEALASASFQVAVLRPPMVYGKDCKGNFQLLRKLVEKSPVFPAVDNQRSMISINNLCAFVRLVLDEPHCGVFCPQNKEYVNTTEMARIMAKTTGKSVWFSRSAGLAIRLLMPMVPKARKAFASLTYRDCEQFAFCYCQEDLETSVQGSIR